MDKTKATIINSKKVESPLAFSDCINRIWTILKDKMKIFELCNTINFFQQIMPNLNLSPANQTQSRIQIICKEFVTDNFYKSISYIVEFFNNLIIFKFMLYSNTLDNSTLVILEIEYEDKSIPQVDTFYQETTSSFLEALNAFLKTNAVYLYEYQSILINCPLINVWNLIVNNKHFDSISHSGPMQLSNKLDKAGNEFTYEIGNERKYARAKKCERDHKREWVFVFDLYDQNYTHVNCQITFFFLYIQDSTVFLSYHHDFKEPIEQNDLNEVAQRKKEFLNDLKEYLEK